MAPGYQSVSQSVAIQVAEAHDFVVAQPQKFAPWVSVMKQVNPNLLLLVYQNSSFSYPSQSFSETTYSHDASGNRIQSRGFGTYLMRPNSAAWQNYEAQTCTSNLAKSGYDGCYLDTMGDGILSTGYLTALPVNPSTGQPYTDQQWVSAETSLAQAVKSANGSVPLVGNMVGNGQRYWSATATTVPILQVLGGGMEEMFLRNAYWAVGSYKTAQKWLQDVTTLSDAEANGHWIAATTKVWVNATTAQVNSWHRYALASFLLGTGGHDRFAFMASSTAGMGVAPYDAVALGQPAGAMTQAGTAYERQFANGLVVVNPNTSSVTLSLSGTYVDLDGKAVTSSITLAPETGDVLVSASPMPAPVSETEVPSLSTGTASLAGEVSGRGSTGTTYFQWGTSKTYGSTTPVQTLGAGWSSSSATISGLTSGTKYNYRVATVTPAGVTYGSNMVFKAK
jgi:hypothetical protein